MSIIKFKINGLTCEACVKLSTFKLKKLPGVKDVKISLATGEAKVAAESELDFSAVSQALAGTDYSAVKL